MTIKKGILLPSMMSQKTMYKQYQVGLAPNRGIVVARNRTKLRPKNRDPD